MVTIPTLRELYDYNYWARDRQLEVCATLGEEQFLRPAGNSFGSVRDTLAHLLGVEWVWHERFRGRSPRSEPPWLAGLRSVDAMRERWKLVEADLRNFLPVLNDEALGQPLTYVNFAGKTWTHPLGHTLLHLANHQTYHRGQVTTLLRQLGAVPPAIDFLVYCDKAK